MMDRIADGRTDLVLDYLAQGHPATSRDTDGTSLINWCAYYGDVTALRVLLAKGESLHSMGNDLGLNGAAFHGHWQLCQFLLENGADANSVEPDSGETPLHAALSSHRATQKQVVEVLLAHKADPNRAAKPRGETGAFMRDCYTKAETPLHRAAAFASEETIQLLLDAGAKLDARDMNGETPLGWASWYLRPDSILRKLLYGGIRIHPDRKTTDENLRGIPHA